MVQESEQGTRGHRGDTPAARQIAALTGTLVVLAIWNVGVRPILAPSYHLPLRLLVAVVVVSLGLWGGLGVDGLGLSRRRVGSGLRWGSAAFGVVLVVLLVGALLPSVRGSFDIPRAHVGLADLLRQVLVVIPVSTVVVEELAFRGTLLGLLCALLPRGWAIAWCSLLFGLWHLDSVVTSTTGGPIHVALAGLGTVAATGTAGAVFCWLRLRSASLVAPLLAHLATNTIALAVAWVIVQ